jgi:hypothetical protein
MCIRIDDALGISGVFIKIFRFWPLFVCVFICLCVYLFVCLFVCVSNK